MYHSISAGKGVRVCACTQSCLTLCDPLDCGLPGSSVPGIRLEWVTISYSSGFFTQVIHSAFFFSKVCDALATPPWTRPLSCLTPCNSVDCSPPGFSVHGVLQTRILEWVAIPFSRGPSWPRVEPQFPTLQANSLLCEPPGKSSEPPAKSHYLSVNCNENRC